MDPDQTVTEPSETPDAVEPRGDPAGEASEPAYVAELRAQLKEMSREQAKLRRRLSDSSGQPEGDPRPDRAPSQARQPEAMSRDEVAAAVRWGQLALTLTEGQRKELEADIEAGGSYRDAVRMAEFAVRYGPRKPPQEPRRGEVRSGAAQRSDPNMTYAQFQALGVRARKGDAEAQRQFAALIEDPDFNVRALK